MSIPGASGPCFDLPTFDPLVAAEVAKLRYVSDRVPGIVRLRADESFIYRDPEGRPIRDPARNMPGRTTVLASLRYDAIMSASPAAASNSISAASTACTSTRW